MEESKMTIEARIPLTLPKVKTQVIISYNTYEDATFDQYLVASIVCNAHSNGEMERYIDDITGKGSLNNHFKKLVEDIMKMDETTRTKVLSSSIYPVTKIDKNHRFTYYSIFDVSIYNNKLYNGNLKDYSAEELINIFKLPHDIDIIDQKYEDTEDSKKDQYTVKFEANNISVKLTNKEWSMMSSKEFKDLYVAPLYDVENRYNGIIKNVGDGSQWVELTEGVMDTLAKDTHYYYDENGNHVSIGDDLAVTQIINVFGLYLYKKEHFGYTSQNCKKCQVVITHLIKTQQLFDFPHNSLLKLTRSVDELTQQMVVNHILIRREDSSIAEIGIGLLSKIRDGWEKEALRSMKSYSTQNLTIFYKIDHDLDYSDEELSRMEETVLSPKDKIRVNTYRNNRKNKIREINELIGIITSSGIRERMKKVKATDKTMKLTKELNTHIGHKKDDISKYTDTQLDEYLERVKSMYKLYLEVHKYVELRSTK